MPVLLRSRLRILGNALVRSGPGARGWTLVGVVGAAALVFFGRAVATAALAVDNPAPERLAPSFAGLLGTISVFTAVTAVTFALGALFLARDIEPLLASPVPPRAILLTKLLVQLTTGAAIGAVLAGGPTVTYLAGRGHVGAVVVVGVGVVAMAVFPLLAGTVVTVLAVRLLPARRVRDAGGLLVTLVVFGVTAGNLVTRGPAAFTAAPTVVAADRPPGIADSAWLPTGWCVRAAVAAADGDTARALAWLVPMTVLAAALLLLGCVALERPFHLGWQRSQESGRGRRRVRRARTVRGGVVPVWRALVVKDMRETLRDPSQLGQLALPLALFALYVASPTAVGPQRVATLPSWFTVLLTAGFASLFAASGVALRGVGMEGRRLAVLRSAPVDTRAIVAAKFLVGSGVAVALGLLLLLIGLVHLRLGPLEAVAVALRFVVLVGGLVGLAVGAGAMRPRLDWTDPRRSVGVGASIGFLALGSTYIGVALLLLALPYAGGHASTAGVALGDAALVLLATVVAAGPLLVGASRLRDMDL